MLKAHVLVFGFRGHGESDGHTVTMGLREKGDVEAAIRYLRTQRTDQAKRLYTIGISMGSAALVGAGATMEPPLDGYILDSGFASAMDLTDTALAYIPRAIRSWITVPGVPLACLHAGCSFDELRPESQVASLRAPVLIAHSDHDGLIPVAHSRRLYDNAREPKVLYTAPTPGGHCSVLFQSKEGYVKCVQDMFMRR